MNRRGSVDDIPESYFLETREPRLRLPWSRLANVVGVVTFGFSVIGGIAYAGFKAGTTSSDIEGLKSDVLTLKSDVAYIRSRIDGAPARPQPPLTAIRSSPLDTIQQVTTANDTPSRTASAYSKGNRP